MEPVVPGEEPAGNSKQAIWKFILQTLISILTAILSRPELISVLLLARKQWPSAKILGVSELGLEVRDQRIISSGRLCPSDAMNQIRRTLSELP